MDVCAVIDSREHSSDQTHKNPYLETALTYTRALIAALNPAWESLSRRGIKITIFGDNDFYSQRSELKRRGLPLCTQSLESLTKCAPLGCNLANVHKTGLGSSAAMMSSVIGALLAFFEICDPTTKEGKTWIHNLTQFCHCLAQGKIGSGFDVSSAIYGTHLYQRFSPEILNASLKLAEEKTLSSDQLVTLVTKTEYVQSLLWLTISDGIIKWNPLHCRQAFNLSWAILTADPVLPRWLPNCWNGNGRIQKEVYNTYFDDSKRARSGLD